MTRIKIRGLRCGGRDSNPRTPLRVDLEPTAVDHLATSASLIQYNFDVFLFN